MANFDVFLGPVDQAERLMLRVRIFLPEFFLFLQERKRIAVTFFMFFFVF
jgi:hypothetical protein